MNNVWFEEVLGREEGRTVKIAVDKILLENQSQYQKIEIYNTKAFGKMLVLDGVVMLTEFDNFAYHEMMVHVPMMVHPCAENILVVGGGDGGIVLELLKYPQVKNIVVCEIDEDVINECKKYFPELAESFGNPKVKIKIEDAALFVQERKDVFDVICVDSTDPFGPGEVLFTKEFYQNLYSALKEDGIVTTQSESMYYDSDFIVKLCKQNQDIFPIVNYYYTMVPTYPSGTIGFSYCSKKYDYMENLSENKIKELGELFYYNLDIHKSAFVLPNFIKEKLRLKK